MDSNELNHNDDLDIVMIKLELTISEKQLVENTLGNPDLTYAQKQDDLIEIIGEKKTLMVMEWVKNSNLY